MPFSPVDVIRWSLKFNIIKCPEVGDTVTVLGFDNLATFIEPSMLLYENYKLLQVIFERGNDNIICVIVAKKPWRIWPKMLLWDSEYFIPTEFKGFLKRNINSWRKDGSARKNTTLLIYWKVKVCSFRPMIATLHSTCLLLAEIFSRSLLQLKARCWEPPGRYLCTPEPGRPGCIISIEKGVKPVDATRAEKRLVRKWSFSLYILVKMAN